MKTTNKFIGTIIILFVTALAFTACSPEDGNDGKDGLDGQNGAQGAQGPTGNANVTLYEFTEGYDFESTIEFIFTCDSSIEDAENSLWQTFLARETGNLYSVSGYGYNNSTLYKSYLRIATGTSNIHIRKQTGPGEIYSKVRIFRILANNTGGTANRTMGRLYNGYTEEEVKAMSYEEFVNAFELSVD